MNMETFEYDSHSNHVIFGNDTINQLPRELARQNLKQPLILSTSGRVGLAEKVRGLLDGQVAGVFAGAIMHTPLPVTDKAVEYAQAQEADSVVSIGGGSTVGLGKAISIRLNIPHICIPTTYSGSEMTTHLGETANGKKVVRSDPKILPGTVIYDVMLTNTLSPETSATSGVNAMAHAGNIWLAVCRNVNANEQRSRGIICTECQSSYISDGKRSNNRVGSGVARDRRKPFFCLCEISSPLWCLAFRGMPRQRCSYGRSPQALSHFRRKF